MEKVMELKYKGLSFIIKKELNTIYIISLDYFVPRMTYYNHLIFEKLFETYPILNNEIVFSKRLRYDYSDQDFEKFVSSDMIKTIIDKRIKSAKSFLENRKKKMVKELDCIEQHLNVLVKLK